jgi:hemolysin III
MGWMALAGIGEILRSLPLGALIWLLLGGLFFTGGAVIYILKKPDFVPGVFGFHEVWHIFVILGALSHYVLVAAYVAAPGAG